MYYYYVSMGEYETLGEIQLFHEVKYTMEQFHELVKTILGKMELDSPFELTDKLCENYGFNKIIFETGVHQDNWGIWNIDQLQE